MKKIIVFWLMFFTLCVSQSKAQNEKQRNKDSKTEKTRVDETSDARHESHKKFWKKTAEDQRDFWKGEHERHVKKDAVDKPSIAGDKKDRRPPKPPNPFKRKRSSSLDDEDNKGVEKHHPEDPPKPPNPFRKKDKKGNNSKE